MAASGKKHLDASSLGAVQLVLQSGHQQNSAKRAQIAEIGGGRLIDRQVVGWKDLVIERWNDTLQR